MKFTHDHRFLFSAVAALFVALTLGVAIFPALRNQASFKPLPGSQPLLNREMAGKKLYIANGCVACHTQQVRNVAMDKVWGSRPSIAADYARIKRTSWWANSATLMGSERTGPDLTTIGERQPSDAWQLMHLYNPRSVVPQSIMPAYPWLFEIKEKADPTDTVVNLPPEFQPGNRVVVAKKEALQLVAYLLSLKQTPLPSGMADPEFLFPRKEAGSEEGQGIVLAPDGGALYRATCQACHQANGEGLTGAFPSLKGSEVVLEDSPEKLITIIMKGYEARTAEGYPPMPPIGTMNKLTAEQIHAIINHERTSWGNAAPGGFARRGPGRSGGVEMKSRLIILLAGLFALPLTTKACEACNAGQPEILRGLTHGTGPQGNMDYVIVAAAIIFVLVTLVYAVKFLVRPGEREADHIKRTILNFDHHGL